MPLFDAWAAEVSLAVITLVSLNDYAVAKGALECVNEAATAK